MPRQKSLLTVIRDLVREEVGSAISALLSIGSTRKKSANGRRKRRRKRGTRGPGRPPGSKNKKG